MARGINSTVKPPDNPDDFMKTIDLVPVAPPKAVELVDTAEDRKASMAAITAVLGILEPLTVAGRLRVMRAVTSFYDIREDI